MNCPKLDINKTFFYRIAGTSIITILLSALVVVSMASCKNVVSNNSNKEPTETKPFRKEPEPQEPFIQGNFSGLADEELITLYIQGKGGQWGTRRGNGSWESVISNARDGERYSVTAEVPGYVSTPESYTIITQGEKAYLVKDGQITSDEAKNLDFHFTPLATPTQE
ncbi:hypothetical protein ACFLZW_01475 [Chloroflexota bacterium]